MIEALASPALISFFCGAMVAAILRRALPSMLATALATTVLGLLGLKSGLTVANGGWDVIHVVPISLVVAASSAGIAAVIFRRMSRLNAVDTGALAIHYASVSVATYPLLTSYLERSGLSISPRIPATFVVLEILGLIAGLVAAAATGASILDWRTSLRETVLGRSIVVLLAAFVVGAIGGGGLDERVGALVRGGFDVILPAYMVSVGFTLGPRLADLRRTSLRLVVGAVAVSILGVAVAAGLAALASWGVAETAALLVMTASASYVAAPGVVRHALPDANPAVYLTCAIGITFPLNVAVGIPAFVALARVLA